MAGFEKDFVRSFLGMHRQMERFLNDVFHCGRSPSFAGEHSWSPAVDVFETENSYVVKVEVSGLDKDNLEVTFDDGQLTISGCRHDVCVKEKVICRQMEIPYGRFKRAIFISKNVDGDNITAGYVAGFLEICLPRSEAARHRRVEIEVE